MHAIMISRAQQIVYGLFFMYMYRSLETSSLRHVIGASVREPHASELAGGFSICIYVYYVRDSVYLFKRRPAPGLGTRSTATSPGARYW